MPTRDRLSFWACVVMLAQRTYPRRARAAQLPCDLGAGLPSQ